MHSKIEAKTSKNLGIDNGKSIPIMPNRPFLDTFRRTIKAPTSSSSSSLCTREVSDSPVKGSSNISKSTVSHIDIGTKSSVIKATTSFARRDSTWSESTAPKTSNNAQIVERPLTAALSSSKASKRLSKNHLLSTSTVLFSVSQIPKPNGTLPSPQTLKIKEYVKPSIINLKSLSTAAAHCTRPLEHSIKAPYDNSVLPCHPEITTNSRSAYNSNMSTLSSTNHKFSYAPSTSTTLHASLKRSVEGTTAGARLKENLDPTELMGYDPSSICVRHTFSSIESHVRTGADGTFPSDALSNVCSLPAHPPKHTTFRAGEISTNFVRKNLKRKFGGFQINSSKAPPRARSNTRDQEYCNTAFEFERADKDPHATSSKLDRGSCNGSGIIHGAVGQGTDLLLEAINSLTETTTTNLKLSSTEESIVNKQANNANKVDLLLRPTAPLSTKTLKTSISSNDEALARGLSSPGTRKRSRILGKTARQARLLYGGMDDDALQEIAPKCPGHCHPAKLIIVKKKGDNKGRRFYGCSYPSDQRCEFFLWAEDNMELVSILMKRKAVESTLLANMTPQEAFRSTALNVYEVRLQDMTLTELRQEARRCLIRRKLECFDAPENDTGGACALIEEADETVDEEEDEIEESEESSKCDKSFKVYVSSNPTKEKKSIREEINCATCDSAERFSNAELKTSSKLRGKDSGRDLTSHIIVDIYSSSDSNSDSDLYTNSSLSECGAKFKTKSAFIKKKLTPSLLSYENHLKLRTKRASKSMRSTGTSHNIESGLPRLRVSGSRSSLIAELLAEAQRVLERDGSLTVPIATAQSQTQKQNAFGKTSPLKVLHTSIIDQDPGVVVFSDDDLDGKSTALEHYQKPIILARSSVTRPGLPDVNPSAAIQVKYSPNCIDSRSTKPHVDLEQTMLLTLRSYFGFTTFRPGQKWAVERCILGYNSLLVMPTGAGKSLCYQLPASLLPGITVVVSPLISLMLDQIKRLPVQLPGGCISGRMSAQQSASLAAAMIQGHVKILFVSPERFCNAAFRRLMEAVQQSVDNRRGNSSEPASAVSLLCVDEAHCLSQWSFNFRPAFLRIGREIRWLQPRAVLAVTATASKAVQKDIMQYLGIPHFASAPNVSQTTESIDKCKHTIATSISRSQTATLPQLKSQGLLTLPSKRDNLTYFAMECTDEESKRKALMTLLRALQLQSQSNSRHSSISGTGLLSTLTIHSRTADVARQMNRTNAIKNDFKRNSERSRSLGSSTSVESTPSARMLPTIIYVTRRAQTESLSEFLRASGYACRCYHAGLSPTDREEAQRAFLRGTSSIMVATIAFGLGIDKEDVRCVVHYSIPKSLENYIQETGRAGRDGGPATCLLLLNRDDLQANASQTQHGSVALLQIVALLHRVFIPYVAIAGENQQNQPQLQSHVALEVSSIEKELSISGVTAETILCILELPPCELIRLEGVHPDVAQGWFRPGKSYSAAVARGDILVLAIKKFDFLAANHLKRRGGDSDGCISMHRTGQQLQPKKERIFVHDNGMGDASSYGLGAGLLMDDAENDACKEYGPQMGIVSVPCRSAGEIDVRFRVSIQHLCRELGILREEVCSGLYRLQQQGVLAYSLTEPALVVQVRPDALCTLLDSVYSADIIREAGGNINPNPDGNKSQKITDKFDNDLAQGILSLAGRLHTQLSGYHSVEYRRALSMWKVGRTIATAASTESTNLSSSAGSNICNTASINASDLIRFAVDALKTVSTDEGADPTVAVQYKSPTECDLQRKQAELRQLLDTLVECGTDVTDSVGNVGSEEAEVNKENHYSTYSPVHEHRNLLRKYASMRVPLAGVVDTTHSNKFEMGFDEVKLAFDLEPETWLTEKEKSTLLRDAQLLRRHPHLQSSLLYLTQYAKFMGLREYQDGGTLCHKYDCLSNDLLTLCISKLLQGVPVETVSGVNIEGFAGGRPTYGAGQWTELNERYKHVHYQHLLRCLANTCEI